MAEDLSPFVQTLKGIVKGYSKGLWEISGAGSGAVLNAVGADIWRQLVLAGVDNSNTDAAFASFKKYAISSFVDDIDFNVSEDEIVVNVKGCKMHDITDYLEENNAPRSMGCGVASVCSAIMEDITGEPYPADTIESKDGNTIITLKKL